MHHYLYICIINAKKREMLVKFEKAYVFLTRCLLQRKNIDILKTTKSFEVLNSE